LELNKCYCADNLKLLKQINDNSIDLIYSDILYGTGKKFKDYQDLKAEKKVIEDFYISRIEEMYRVLKKTGSIYLQMDYRINHWIRNIMDEVFRYENFRNEIVWIYSGGTSPKKDFGKKHDVILRYTKSDIYTFNAVFEDYAKSTVSRYNKIDEQGKKYKITYFKGKEHKAYMKQGKQVDDVWNISKTSDQKDKYAFIYNSQKPLALMDRIIKSSSNECDILGDFFMGGGSFLVKAKELNRQYIGCDINPKALELTNLRLTS